MGNFMDEKCRKSLEGLTSRNRHTAMILDRDVKAIDAQVRPLEEAGQKVAANRQRQEANKMRRKSRALKRAAAAIDAQLNPEELSKVDATAEAAE